MYSSLSGFNGIEWQETALDTDWTELIVRIYSGRDIVLGFTVGSIGFPP